MTAVLTLPITDTAPIDPIAPRDLADTGDAGDADAVTQALVSPVFRNDSAGRRRWLRRAGCVITALCLAYLTMLGVSITRRAHV